jgi:4-hydroxy-3-methylbut-2-enyl diphosphate reductase
MSATKRVNLRTPEVMEAVQAAVEQHYHSPMVDKLRASGGIARFGDVTVRLAKQFGFCYGVERAIDLAYAARKVFAGRDLYLVGEIIHNPDVNAQLASMGIKTLSGPCKLTEIDNLSPEDVVIVPAFGAEVAVHDRIKARGCQIVDTTCGDVMSVWKRVRQYANDGVTSIIHGKADHEETRATSSRARDSEGAGHFVVVYDLAETDMVCDHIRGKGDRALFLQKFGRASSEGFNPDLHLVKVGVANQTTMLRSETEEVQRRVREAVAARDGSADNFRVFDTICGATQERQDALKELLDRPPDLMLVVGGYNSSNTTHLADMAAQTIPTYFVVNASCLESPVKIRHYDTHRREEVSTANWMPAGPVSLGITAGASCPGNLIEDVLRRFLQLRGIAVGETAVS